MHRLSTCLRETRLHTNSVLWHMWNSFWNCKNRIKNIQNIARIDILNFFYQRKKNEIHMKIGREARHI